MTTITIYGAPNSHTSLRTIPLFGGVGVGDFSFSFFVKGEGSNSMGIETPLGIPASVLLEGLGVFRGGLSPVEALDVTKMSVLLAVLSAELDACTPSSPQGSIVSMGSGCWELGPASPPFLELKDPLAGPLKLFLVTGFISEFLVESDVRQRWVFFLCVAKATALAAATLGFSDFPQPVAQSGLSHPSLPHPCVSWR